MRRESVAGFRGAISLAIALSVPATLSDGAPFPGRQDIIVVTAGVIVLTLLVQGPLLPMAVRCARLPKDTTTDDELLLAESAIASAGVEALPDLAKEHRISDEAYARLAREYNEHVQQVQAKHDVSAWTDYRDLRRQSQPRKRPAQHQQRLQRRVWAADQASRRRRPGTRR